MKKIGSFISELRKEKGLTQNDLGDMLKISGKAVSKWERGLCTPNISILNELSNILGITTTELLSGEKNNTIKEFETLNMISKNNINMKNKMKKAINIVFLILTLISTIFMINNHNNFFVYTIESLSNNFEVDGVIIKNPQQNRIIINEVLYLGELSEHISETKVSQIEVILKSNRKIIYSNTYKCNGLPIDTALEIIEINFVENVNQGENVISNNDLKNISLVIKYNDYKQSYIEYEIPLKIEKEFSNDKLIY